MNIWELPEDVAIREVGARDFRRLAMDDRVAVIDALTMAGFERIEAGSLVPVGGMPEDDAVGEVMARIERKPGMTYSVMVSNPEQAERALTMDPDELTLLMSASESHNRWMTGRGMAESLVGFSKICDLARDQAVTVSALITASFGCSYEGRVPRSVVIDLASRMDNMGIARVTLSDTVGAANPAQVAEMVRTVRMTVPMVHLGLHFQNRRGTALANLVVAVLAGATRFDTAIGGVSGASLTETPGAQGASEEVVYCLREMGINTGVDMTKLLEAARMLAAQLPGGLASKVT